MSVCLRSSVALTGAIFVFGGSVFCRTASADPSPSLTTNFAPPLANAVRWHLQVLGTARAVLTRSAGVAVVKTTRVDSTDYHAQLQCLGTTLVEGQTYTLRFRAKASAKRLLPVYALVNAGDYHGIGLRQNAALGPAWRSFEYTFQAKDLGDGTKLVCPQFTVGNAVGTTYLTDVSLTQAAPGAAVTPPSDPPTWLMQRFDPAQATLLTDDTLQTTTITQTDGEPWHVQLGRLNVPVQDNVTYIVKFRAKADAPRDMMLTGAISEGDYHPICDQQQVALDATWQDYSFPLRLRNSAGHPVNFPQFLLGKKTGTVSIDQVTVTSPEDKGGVMVP